MTNIHIKLMLLFGISNSQTLLPQTNRPFVSLIDDTPVDWDPSQFNYSDPSTWRPIIGPYKMGNLVTCLEQNDEDPYGYKEKFTYGDTTGESAVCQASPEMCARYQNMSYEYGGTGDVCDHEDPLVHDVNGNRLVRDVCKFTVMFLPEVDDEKSWAWKCARHEICPLVDMNEYYYDANMEKVYGAGVMGCIVNTKRVMCCCQGDYCQSKPLYATYAQFGNPEFYPIDWQVLANIDPGDEYIEYDLPEGVVIPDWDCIHAGECPYPTNANISTSETNSSTTLPIIEEIEDEIAEIEEDIAELNGGDDSSDFTIVDALTHISGMECITQMSAFSTAEDDAIEWVTCPDTHPHLMSCGAFTQVFSDANTDGAYIDGVGENDNPEDRARCVAQNGYGGQGVAAMARCCSIPSVTSCSYAYTEMASGIGDAQYVTCDSAGYGEQFTVGCGHTSSVNSYFGSYLGGVAPLVRVRNIDWPTTEAFYSGRCQVEDGASDGETYGQITCCDAPSDAIYCKVRFSEPGQPAMTTCGEGYALTSCSGYSETQGLGRWFVNNADQCYATSTDGNDVYASALCCKMASADADISAAAVFGADGSFYNELLAENGSKSDAVTMEDMLWILCGFFLFVVVCFGIGIFIGTKMPNNKRYGHVDVINNDF